MLYFDELLILFEIFIFSPNVSNKYNDNNKKFNKNKTSFFNIFKIFFSICNHLIKKY